MRPTPMNTPPAISSGLDWPFSQPTKLREKKLAASAVREVTDDILGIDPPQSDTRDWLASLAADLPDAVDGGPAMAGKPEVIVWLELSEEADGMVHFKADDGETAPVREVYLDKAAHAGIGSPTHIRLTIEEEQDGRN